MSLARPQILGDRGRLGARLPQPLADRRDADADDGEDDGVDDIDAAGSRHARRDVAGDDREGGGKEPRPETAEGGGDENGEGREEEQATVENRIDQKPGDRRRRHGRHSDAVAEDGWAGGGQAAPVCGGRSWGGELGHGASAHSSQRPILKAAVQRDRTPASGRLRREFP